MIQDKEYIKNFCKERKIYVYGAGKLGRQCMCYLQNNSIIAEGYVVTHVEDNTKSDGVFALESVVNEKNAGFIIAGNNNNSLEMYCELEKKGVTEFVFYKEEIEERINTAIATVQLNRDKGTALYCDGIVSRIVLNRVGSIDLPIITCENNHTHFNSTIYNLEETIINGIDKIIILSDTDEKTADLYLEIRDKAQGINCFDIFGQNLSSYSNHVSILGEESACKKNILMIDEKIPKYDTNAGNRLTYFYLLCYVKLGCSVWFLPVDITPNGYEHGLEEQGVHVVYGEPYGKLWLVANSDKFDIVFLHRPECAEYYLDAIKAYCKKATVIYHPADLHYLRLQRQYELTGDISKKAQAEKYKRIETRVINDSDYIYVVGSKEKQLVEDLSPGKLVRDIPIYLYDEKDIPYRKPAFDRKDILFVGSFGHSPNIDAVEWLAKEILPDICACIPDIKCHVVGGNAPESFLKFGNDNLVFEGYISDEELREMYLGCRLSIAPLRFGAGIKGKIIEAAYYGLPVVTTTIGAEGVHDAEKFITVADTVESFADEVVRLYEDFDRIDSIAESTKEVIADNYTSKVAEDILRADLDKEITD